jgi:hypothetical protein
MAAGEAGKLSVLLRSTIESIIPASVVVNTAEARLELPNDAIIVSAGEILPMGMLRDIGVMALLEQLYSCSAGTKGENGVPFLSLSFAI